MSDSLYNIEPREFKILKRSEIGSNITYLLEPLESPDKCPRCHANSIIHHGVNKRKARDLNEFEKKVGIIVVGHRYQCQKCGKTWVDKYKSLDTSAKTTNRMRTYIVDKALSTKFTVVAQELDISVTLIEKLLNRYIDELEQTRQIEAPKVLGLDETRINGVYIGVYVDVEKRKIIDITADRKYNTIKEWLNNIPNKDRIECVTIDMWGPYKDALFEAVPNAMIVIDRFHVSKLLNEAFDNWRKRFIDELVENDKSIMKGSRWLLLRNWDELGEEQQQELYELFIHYPMIHKAHSIKEAFRRIYNAKTREEAEILFDQWKKTISDIPEYQLFCNVVEKWRIEIFNYFEKRVTNAVTESMNNICKRIALEGNGYSFKLLRAKIIYQKKVSLRDKYVYSYDFQDDC